MSSLLWGLRDNETKEEGKKPSFFLPVTCFKIKLCYKMCTKCMWTPKLFPGAGLGIPKQVINTLLWG